MVNKLHIVLNVICQFSDSLPASKKQFGCRALRPDIPCEFSADCCRIVSASLFSQCHKIAIKHVGTIFLKAVRGLAMPEDSCELRLPRLILEVRVPFTSGGFKCTWLELIQSSSSQQSRKVGIRISACLFLH